MGTDPIVIGPDVAALTDQVAQLRADLAAMTASRDSEHAERGTLAEQFDQFIADTARLEESLAAARGELAALTAENAALKAAIPAAAAPLALGVGIAEITALTAIGQNVRILHGTEDAGKGDGSRVQMFIRGRVIELQDGGAIVARIEHPGNAADGQAVRVAAGNWQPA